MTISFIKIESVNYATDAPTSNIGIVWLKRHFYIYKAVASKAHYLNLKVNKNGGSSIFWKKCGGIKHAWAMALQVAGWPEPADDFDTNAMLAIRKSRGMHPGLSQEFQCSQPSQLLA